LWNDQQFLGPRARHTLEIATQVAAGFDWDARPSLSSTTSRHTAGDQSGRFVEGIDVIFPRDLWAIRH